MFSPKAKDAKEQIDIADRQIADAERIIKEGSMDEANASNEDDRWQAEQREEEGLRLKEQAELDKSLAQEELEAAEKEADKQKAEIEASDVSDSDKAALMTEVDQKYGMF